MRRPNQALAEHMARADMRPPRLVAEINALLGDGYVSRSTVSEWLHAGRVPREPLPAVIASVLSDATGSRIRVEDLWPGACLAPTWAVPADDGLDRITHTPSPATELAQDWVRHAGLQWGRDRRRFVPVPAGRIKLSAASSAASADASASGQWSTAAQPAAAQFARLPDRPAAVRYVHRQVLAFCGVLLDEGWSADAAAALCLVTTTAADTARAMGEPGLAQRYRASAGLFLLPPDRT